ncbi:MAG: hypothetical protein KatS3mg038_1345 [Candidatus Kapaibacterium sp.]|nr:MAG: hypothetical protein KatS3mg038_1345 [Candidatus Kapabacteria bacterium]
MRPYYVFPDDLPSDANLPPLLTESVLIIPSEHHKQATTLLREQFFRPLEHRRVPWIKQVAYHVMKRAPRFDPNRRLPPDAIRRILVLRYDGLGDYLVTTPLLQWLRRTIPHLEIDLLTSQRNDILAADDPIVHYHVPIHDRPQFHRSVLRAVHRLRPRQYDLVVAPVLNNMTRQAVLARALAPSADYVTFRREWAASLYGQVFHRQVPYKPWHQHWLEAYFSLGPATVASTEQEQRLPRMWLPESELAEDNVHRFLRTHELESDGWERCPPSQGGRGQPYMVINISASNEERSLSVEQVHVLCKKIREEFPTYAVVLVSSPRHQERGASIATRLGPPCYYYYGSFVEMVPLLRNCRWIITPDTALVHVASALRTPVIGLYHRPVTVCEWYPYGTRFLLLLHMNHSGLAALPIEPVVHATRMLEASLRRTPAQE